MTNAATRRTVLATLAGAGLAGAVMGRGAALAGAAVALPGGPMLLERRLERGLGDRAAITVTRCWRIGFARQARGITVSGNQIMAEVEAPDHLAELARIERQRDDSAVFPVTLGDDGLIMLPAMPGAAQGDLARSLAAAEALIARQPVPAETRARYLHYLALMHQAGAGLFERMPADLFYPTGVPVERREALMLADGTTGSFTLVWSAMRAPQAGWLAEGERIVITRIEGLERRSRERWRLLSA